MIGCRSFLFIVVTHCRKHFFIIEKLRLKEETSFDVANKLDGIICKAEQYAGRPRKWYASDLSDLQYQVSVMMEYFSQDTTVVYEYLSSILQWDTVKYVCENDIPVLKERFVGDNFAELLMRLWL